MGSASEQLMSLQAQLRRLNNDQRPNATPRGEPSQPWPGSPHQEVREIRMNIDSGPATIPASSVSEHNQDQRTPSRPRDLISDGLLTVEEAHHLFEVYAHRLDHYLYRILGSEATFKGTRTSSSVLFAAICTVGALHSSRLRHLYGRCYRRFQTLTADLALSKDANLDDIRGLCIGAFWLHEISWNLSSIGMSNRTQNVHVRFISERCLHQPLWQLCASQPISIFTGPLPGKKTDVTTHTTRCASTIWSTSATTTSASPMAGPP